MNEFKCVETGCEYTAKAAGYCPTHGKKLEAVDKSAAGEDDEKLTSILEKFGKVIEDATKEALKKNGLDVENKAIHPADKGVKTRAQVYEKVKSLVDENPVDKSLFDECVTDKEKNDFLGKARIAYFFKNLIQFQTTKDYEHLQVVKALAEGVDADGGYLTPREFRAELVRSMRDEPFLRNWVRVIPMGSDFLELPTLATNVTTSWGSENTSISTTTAAFGTLTFAPKRLNSLMYTSRELVADSAISIVPLITELFVEAIGLEEDRVIVDGSGTGQPKGILRETLGGIDNANVDANLADNIKKLPYRLPKFYRRNARWLANPRALESISVLKDTTNQYLMKGLEDGPTESTLAGLPIMEQGDMPGDTLLLGDFKQYFLADRQRISVETTTEGAGTFEKHQVAIKIVERIDGKVAITNAFKTITNAGLD